jgi:HEPN domain-containing protein
MDAPKAPPEWLPWVEQAEHDLGAARANAASGFSDIAVMLAEQAAEKAVKAVWIARRGVLAPRVHLVGQLLKELGAPADLAKAGTALARGYFAVRYPTFEDSAPFRVVEPGDAEVAIADAERVLAWAREELPQCQA